MTALAARPMPDALRIHDADRTHEPDVRALSDATHRSHRVRLPHAFGPENSYQHWLLARAFDQGPAKSRHRTLLRVACVDNRLRGYVMLVWEQPEDADQTTGAVIADIAVASEAQGQGIAAALLADADALRATHGWHSLSADVWLGNDASHALFAKAGFAAERTQYRKGTPPPLTDTAPLSGPKPSRLFWWVAACGLVAIALVASIP